MRNVIFLFIGALLGGLAACALMNGSEVLDDGISHTYRCDQIALEDDARTSARKVLQGLPEGKSLANLKSVADAAGLQMEHFDKGEYTEIRIGKRLETAALNFNLSADNHISVLPLPGNRPCKNFDEVRAE